MTYETVLFDWDGCLSMTLDTWLDIYKTALIPYGIELTDIEIMTYAGDWSTLEGLGIHDVRDFRARINAEVAARFPMIPLYQGAKILLTQLNKQGVAVGLVTSSERADILKALSHHQLEECFQFIVCGDDVKAHKPHPESILKAIKALNGVPEKTLMIGDSSKDILGALNAGVDSALIYHESHTTYYSLRDLEKSKPTHIFQNFSELAAFLTARR